MREKSDKPDLKKMKLNSCKTVEVISSNNDLIIDNPKEQRDKYIEKENCRRTYNDTRYIDNYDCKLHYAT